MNRKLFRMSESWDEMGPEEKDEFLDAVLDEVVGPAQKQPSPQPSSAGDNSEAE